MHDESLKQTSEGSALSISTTVQKAFNCLEALATLGGIASVNDVAAAVSISRAGAARLLDTMARSGALTWDPASKRYSFALQFYEWGGLAPQTRQFMPIIRRHVVALTAELQRRIDVLVAEFPQVFHIEFYDWMDGFAIPSPAQHRVPWWRTTSGMVIAAFSSPDVAEELIRDAEVAAAALPITPSEMMEQVRDIREQGYALSFGRYARTIGVVVPVFDSSECAIAAISVPSAREEFTEENQALWLAAARAAASRASAQLGSRSRLILGVA